MFMSDEPYQPRELMERLALQMAREKEEAMAAGYAQGVEATEARAIKRITELEGKIKELQKRDGVILYKCTDHHCDCERLTDANNFVEGPEEKP